MFDPKLTLEEVVPLVNSKYNLNLSEKQIKIHKLSFRAQQLKYVEDLTPVVLETLPFMDLLPKFVDALIQALKEPQLISSPSSPRNPTLIPPPPPTSRASFSQAQASVTTASFSIPSPRTVTTTTPDNISRSSSTSTTSSNSTSIINGSPKVEIIPTNPLTGYNALHRYSQGVHVTTNPLHSQASPTMMNSYLSATTTTSTTSVKSTSPVTAPRHMCCVCGETAQTSGNQALDFAIQAIKDANISISENKKLIGYEGGLSGVHVRGNNTMLSSMTTWASLIPHRASELVVLPCCHIICVTCLAAYLDLLIRREAESEKIPSNAAMGASGATLRSLLCDENAPTSLLRILCPARDLPTLASPRMPNVLLQSQKYCPADGYGDFGNARCGKVLSLTFVKSALPASVGETLLHVVGKARRFHDPKQPVTCPCTATIERTSHPYIQKLKKEEKRDNISSVVTVTNENNVRLNTPTYSSAGSDQEDYKFAGLFNSRSSSNSSISTATSSSTMRSSSSFNAPQKLSASSVSMTSRGPPTLPQPLPHSPSSNKSLISVSPTLPPLLPAPLSIVLTEKEFKNTPEISSKYTNYALYVEETLFRETCHSCLKVVCTICQKHHSGLTCEEYEISLTSPSCRFCQEKKVFGCHSFEGRIFAETQHQLAPPPYNTKNSRAAVPEEYTERVPIPLPVPEALSTICNSDACFEKGFLICPKMLPCGCPCPGVRGELVCPPCLVHNTNNHDEECFICMETMSQGPIIVSGMHTHKLGHIAPSTTLPPLVPGKPSSQVCRHTFHYQCIMMQLESGAPTNRLSFEFRLCPLCRLPFFHPALYGVLEKILSLEQTITARSIQRLLYESRQFDGIVTDPSSEWYMKPVEYAMHIFVFYNCSKCTKPYFAGGYECQAAGEDDDGGVGEGALVAADASAGDVGVNAGVVSAPAPSPNDNLLLCPSCQPSSFGECRVHGKEMLAYKCKYCCSPSFWACWGSTHFCGECHKPTVWQKLSTHKTGKNKKKIHEYPQCPSVASQIAKLRSDPAFLTLSSEEQEAEYSKIASDPANCPLKIAHPPNGFSFATGCIMCNSNSEELILPAVSTPRISQSIRKGSGIEGADNEDQNDDIEEGAEEVAEGVSNNGRQSFIVLPPNPEHVDSKNTINIKEEVDFDAPKANSSPDDDKVDVKEKRDPSKELFQTPAAQSHSHKSDNIEILRKLEPLMVLPAIMEDQRALHETVGLYYFLVLLQNACNDDKFVAPSYSIGDVLAKYEKYSQYIRPVLTSGTAFNNSLLTHFHPLSEIPEREKDRIRKFTFKYNYDFDRNGLFYFLGTLGYNTDFRNPGSLGLVTVRSSRLLANCVAPHEICSRKPVRWVTVAEQEAFLYIKLNFGSFSLNAYSLRHYTSFDGEALRNWKIEGSDDGRTWDEIFDHKDDESIQGLASTSTWKLQTPTRPYRRFRLRMTGLNSNGNRFLALGGIELYGTLTVSSLSFALGRIDEAQAPLRGTSLLPSPIELIGSSRVASKKKFMPTISRLKSPSGDNILGNNVIPLSILQRLYRDHLYLLPATPHSHLYGMPFGPPISLTTAGKPLPNSIMPQNMALDGFSFPYPGIFYRLGTGNAYKPGSMTHSPSNNPWRDPVANGLINIRVSGVLEKGSSALRTIIAPYHARDPRIVILQSPEQYILFDLGYYRLAISGFAIRHFASHHEEIMRTFDLQVSEDSFTWTSVSEHFNDTSIISAGQSASWTLKIPHFYPGSYSRPVRYLRLRQLGLNSSNRPLMVLASIEFYGELFSAKPNFALSDSMFLSYEMINSKLNIAQLHNIGVSNLHSTATPTNSTSNSAFLFSNTNSTNNSNGGISSGSGNANLTVNFINSNVNMSGSGSESKIAHLIGLDSKNAPNTTISTTSTAASTSATVPVAVGSTGTPFIVLPNGTTNENIDDDFDAPHVPFPELEVFEFRREHDFDTKGVIYHIGTMNNTITYRNPAGESTDILTQKIVRPPPEAPRLTSNNEEVCLRSSINPWFIQVHSSFLAYNPPSKTANAIFDRESSRCVTASTRTGAFYAVDLGPHRRLIPNEYTLRHYSSFDVECVRNWQLLGSNDGYTWDLLANHRNDTSLLGKNSTASWKIHGTRQIKVKNNFHSSSSVNQVGFNSNTNTPHVLTNGTNGIFMGYRCFMIWQTGVNSNGNSFLPCSGVEFYGRLFYSPIVPINTSSLPLNIIPPKIPLPAIPESEPKISSISKTI